MKQIGIIGGGIMAAGMVRNFLENNYIVYVWNRTKDHVQPLLESGARWCETPKDVATNADIVIECVSDDDASRHVWTDETSGILTGADTGKVLIASSSLSLDWVDELGSLCQARGLQFLDMPLTGSRAGAEGGALRLLIGGDKAVLESVRADLEVIAEKIFYFGPAGSGMRFKLMLNTLIGVQTNAAAQAILLAKKAGIDPAAFREAIVDGAMGVSSPTTANALKYVEAPTNTINFAAKWLEKDLRYALEMAKRYDTRFDLLEQTQQDYARALDSVGDEDITHIAKQYGA